MCKIGALSWGAKSRCGLGLQTSSVSYFLRSCAKALPIYDDDGGRDGAGGNGRGSDNIILKSRNADSQARIRKRENQALQAHIRKREHQSALPVNAHLNEEVLRVSWQDETRTGTAPTLPVL